MEHHREIKNTLTWHSEDGKFEAILINGQIFRLNFCEPGKDAKDCGKCLNSTDYKFLKQIHESLGELFDFMNDQEKQRGYSYANEIDS